MDPSLHLDNKYIDMAFGNPMGLVLIGKVEERWGQWESLCKLYRFRHSPLEIFSEVVWALGFERGCGTKAVFDKVLGREIWMRPRDEVGITEFEYTVLDKWLDGLLRGQVDKLAKYRNDEMTK